MTDLSAQQQRNLRVDRERLRYSRLIVMSLGTFDIHRKDQEQLNQAAITVASLEAIIGDAHLGAALTTTTDTPKSGWATGIPGGGSVSDPTGQAAVTDGEIRRQPVKGDQKDQINSAVGGATRLVELRHLLAKWVRGGLYLHSLARLDPTEERRARLSLGIAEWVADSDHMHRLTTQLAARIQPDKERDEKEPWRGDKELDDENMRRGNCTTCGDFLDGAKDENGTRRQLIVARQATAYTTAIRLCRTCYNSWDDYRKRHDEPEIAQWAAMRLARIQRTDGTEPVHA